MTNGSRSCARRATPQPASPGLIGAIRGYSETDGRRLVGISRWESMHALEAGIAGIKEQSDAADRAWAERPTEVLILGEI